MTPPGLADLMLDLAPPGARRILDPSCGSGTILLAAARRSYDRVEGQEADAPLAVMAALRVAFSGGASFDVHVGDSLRDDAYTEGTANAVVCNPPFADRNWGAEDAAGDLGRWEYGVPPRLESELAWVQHALWHTRPGGTVVVLMPPAAAARPSGRRIRSRLLQAGAFRAVISLPPRLAAHYALALQVWVLTKPAKEHSPRPVLMIDASGFAASGQSRAGARPSDTVPTWDEVRTLIQRAWATFSSDDSGLPGNAGGTGDASIGSRSRLRRRPHSRCRPPRRGRRITPARHLPSVPVARVSIDILNRHRSSLRGPARGTAAPAARPPAGPPPHRFRSSGVVPGGTGPERHALHPQNRAPSHHRGERPPEGPPDIITGRNLARAVPQRRKTTSSTTRYSALASARATSSSLTSLAS